jgi:hypothetical protein
MMHSGMNWFKGMWICDQIGKSEHKILVLNQKCEWSSKINLKITYVYKPRHKPRETIYREN